MIALDIISAEHRGMWRLTATMDRLREAIAAGEDVGACAMTTLMLIDYLDAYVDRVHHPKEDAHLFARLRVRDPEARDVIERLEREHREGPEHRERLRRLAAAFARDPGGDSGPLLEALGGFAQHLRAHIRTEETQVFPAARRALTAEDWFGIDAAFLQNDDPLFGETTRAEFEALKARIVALAPDPVGLGGHAGAPVDPGIAQRVAEAVAPGFAAGVAAPAAAGADLPVVLEVRGLSSHYGRIQALHGIDLEVRQGQLVALVGANGAGKTTLLRTISGVQPASGGAIRLFGDDITRLSPDKRVRRGVCQVPEGRQVFGPMTIEDNLRIGAFTRRDGEVAADIERMYALFPILGEMRGLPAGTLSGGQQQMLAMARALMGRPRLLLLDEPSMGLAPLLVEEIFRVVRRLKSEGITVLLVEQNAHAALSIADTGYVIETGRTVLTGPGPELLRNDEVRKAYLGM